MEKKFLPSFVQFCIKNFDFNPEENNSKEKSLNLNPQTEEEFKELTFPNDELSYLFTNECLSLLLKTDKKFIDDGIIQSILIATYNLYLNNKNVSDYLEIIHTLPLKEYIENIEKCFTKVEDLQSFLIFNFTLIAYKMIDKQYYNNINFIILKTSLLYDYAFIRGYIKNDKVKCAIGKIIKVLIKIYIKSTKENDIASKLKYFFFENGNIDNNAFLIPAQVFENGYKEFDGLIQEIKEVLKKESEIKVIIDGLNDLNKLKRIKLTIEDDNEETEI